MEVFLISTVALCIFAMIVCVFLLRKSKSVKFAYLPVIPFLYFLALWVHAVDLVLVEWLWGRLLLSFADHTRAQLSWVKHQMDKLDLLVFEVMDFIKRWWVFQRLFRKTGLSTLGICSLLGDGWVIAAVLCPEYRASWIRGYTKRTLGTTSFGSDWCSPLGDSR